MSSPGPFGLRYQCGCDSNHTGSFLAHLPFGVLPPSNLPKVGPPTLPFRTPFVLSCPVPCPCLEPNHSGSGCSSPFEGSAAEVRGRCFHSNHIYTPHGDATLFWIGVLSINSLQEHENPANKRWQLPEVVREDDVQKVIRTRQPAFPKYTLTIHGYLEGNSFASSSRS